MKFRKEICIKNNTKFMFTEGSINNKIIFHIHFIIIITYLNLNLKLFHKYII